MHHIMAIAGFTTAITSGYFFTASGCFALYSEISSIFLNYNDQLKNTAIGKTILMDLNQVIFFVAYSVTRVICFPWLIFNMFRTIFIFGQKVPKFQLYSMIFCVAQACGVLLLNLYWYRIILRKMHRMIFPKKDAKVDKNEKE